MWAAIRLFFGGLSARAIEIGIAVLAVLGAVLAIFAAGKKSERVNELEREVESGRKSNAIRNKNSALGDAGVDDKLHSDWSR